MFCQVLSFPLSLSPSLPPSVPFSLSLSLSLSLPPSLPLSFSLMHLQCMCCMCQLLFGNCSGIFIAGVLILVLTVVDFTVWAAHVYTTHTVHVVHVIHVIHVVHVVHVHASSSYSHS